jgi:hypothetical protein
MTHLLIGWRAGDLIVINGRGPRWPAPQRSVLIPSSALQTHSAQFTSSHASRESFREGIIVRAVAILHRTSGELEEVSSQFAPGKSRLARNSRLE